MLKVTAAKWHSQNLNLFIDKENYLFKQVMEGMCLALNSIIVLGTNSRLAEELSW